MVIWVVKGWLVECFGILLGVGFVEPVVVFVRLLVVIWFEWCDVGMLNEFPLPRVLV